MEVEDKTANVDVEEAFIVKTDADELCRLCANTDNQLIPIFRGEGLDHNIPVKIEKHLPIIKVTEVDKLPLQICYQCASTLISWHNLYEGCRVADKRLRDILSVDDKLCQEDEAFGDYVDDYRDDYDDTHETLPSSTNTSNLESNPLKDNPTEISTLSDTKAFNETELDTSDERYVANRQTSKCQTADKKELRTQPNIMMVLVDPASVIANSSSISSTSHRPRRIMTKASAAVKSAKEASVVPKPVPIAPKPRIISFAVHNQTDPLLATVVGAALTPIKIEATAAISPERICKPSCVRCGQQFTRQTSLNKHMKRVACCDTKKEWPCDRCDQCYVSRDLLRAHVRDLHPKTATKDGESSQVDGEKKTKKRVGVEKKIACDRCPKKFSTSLRMTEHVRRTHAKPTRTYALKCPRYESDPDVMEFLNRYRMVDDDGTESFKCDHCQYVTPQRYRFFEHYRIHTGERPFACDHCGKSFRTKSFVKRHIMVVHQGIKNFPCDICGQAFSDRRFTENHKRRHTGERPYVCELCGKTFVQSSTLLIHMRFHLDVRNYECDVCHKKFVRRGHMLVHLKRHNNIKDFVCDQCGKAFVDRKMLQDHGVVHSQERPFACVLCGATFKLKKHLVQHDRTHRIK